MNQEMWSEVDRYLCNVMVPQDPALEQALAASVAAGLPLINVAPNQGKLLQMFALMIGAKRILEIGTLGGYSAIWLARALRADGKLVTIEFDPMHASVAKSNIDRAGLSDRVDLRIGRAIDWLPKLEAENAGPFDLVFIDADKESTADYFTWALKLSRPGSVIFVDNIVREGQVSNANTMDARVLGIRRFHEVLSRQLGVTATALQTVGSKGYDGFTLVRVNG